MSSERKEKKPKIEYSISDDGNVIQARIDEKTSFISWRRTVERRRKGGFGLLPGIGAEGEAERKDEWTSVVWEGGELMPPSVWDEKRRKEIMEAMRGTISAATGSHIDSIRLTETSGTVVSWAVTPPTVEKCRHCGASLFLGAKYCHNCGKPV